MVHPLVKDLLKSHKYSFSYKRFCKKSAQYVPFSIPIIIHFLLIHENILYILYKTKVKVYLDFPAY